MYRNDQWNVLTHVIHRVGARSYKVLYLIFKNKTSYKVLHFIEGRIFFLTGLMFCDNLQSYFYVIVWLCLISLPKLYLQTRTCNTRQELR